VADDGFNVLFELWLASRAATGLLDVAIADSGLTADEFGVYSVLTSADALTPTELATWMAAPPTTVSSYVKRFEARGHVERRPNPDDGRSYLIRLTAAGRKAHRDAGAQFLPALRAVQRELGSKESSVRRALGQLKAAVDGAVP
jgi:DNA-binding MarR family transcriptional regulator